jgi:Zn-dependent protease with chaperone function
LLIAAVLASSVFVYQAIYLATSRGAAVVLLIRRCTAQALARNPGGATAYARALGQASVCWSGAEHAEGLWVLLGIGVLAVLALAIFGVQPWWYRWRMRLDRLTGQKAPALLPRLEELRRHAGAGPVVWLLQPYNSRVSAFAFGGFRRRFVAVSGGAAVAAVQRPEVFTGVVLHELAHIRNRDITQTYLAVAIWRAFVAAVLVPLAVLLVLGLDVPSPQRVIWRTAVLALIVYLLRNAIVRSREFDADARVRELDPDTALGRVLESLPARPGRWFRRLGWLHPSGQERAAALRDPRPLFHCGFADGMAVGLVTAIGASAAQELLPQFTTVDFLKFIVPAALFALLSAAALVISMWRWQLFQPVTGNFTPVGWAAGLGLGIGLAAGPVIALQTSFADNLAPDSVSRMALGLSAAWIVLITVIFTPFPVWAGYWADAWQRAAQGGHRTPARGGMAAAIAAAGVVLTFGLYFMLYGFIELGGIASDPSTRHLWAQLWTSAGTYLAGMAGAWIVCLVMVAVPLAGSLARHLRPGLWQRWHAAPWLRRAAQVGALCLAGVLAAAAMTLAVSAVAHAQVAAPVRWNAYYLAAVISFDSQAVAGVAVIFALIAAAWIRSPHSFSIAVAVAAIVAAAGMVVVINSDNIGFCVSAVSIQYAHPPAGYCPSFLGGSFLAQQMRLYATEAALASIILIPAAHLFGAVLGRRGAVMPKRTAVLGVAGIVTAAIVAAVATGFWGADISTHDIKPLGSIGNDGWINGAGYEIRLHPKWFERIQHAFPGQVIIVYTVPGSVIDIYRVPAGSALASFRDLPRLLRLHDFRPRPTVIGGVRGAGLVGVGTRGAIWQASLVRHGPFGYIVAFTTPSGNRVAPELDLAEMLRTWRWSPPG